MALTGQPSDVEIYNNLGVIDEGEGRFKAAESNYKLALKLYPFSAAAINNLGSIYMAEGLEEKAKAYFIRALMLNPLMLDPRRSLASIYLKDSEYQKAIDLCIKNLDIASDDPKTLYLLVDIFLQEKDAVNLNKFAHLLISQENDPGALTKLGVDMARHNVSQLALECFMKAVHVAPDYTEAYLDTGTLLANMGNYVQAIKILMIGSKLDPSDKRFKEYIVKVEELMSRKPI